MRSTSTEETLTSPRSDGVVVAAVLAGDQSAAAELFHRYHPLLLHRMAWWTRDCGRAEDLAQDAWLKAVAALERFDQHARFWPWLRCIGDNVACSDLRLRLTPSGEERVVCFDDQVLARTPAQNDSTARVDDVCSVVGALGAIPARQRDAFLAVAHAGAPIAVAAETLGLNQNAFRQLYHRARHSLRQHLEGAFVTAPVLWWDRLRTTVREALSYAPAATGLQAFAAVAGVVAVIALVPSTGGEARASMEPRPELRTTHRSPAEEDLEVPVLAPDVRRPATKPSSRMQSRPKQRATPRPTSAGDDEDKDAAPVLRAPAVNVEGVPVRGHQKAREDPDFHYGVRVDAPVAGPQQVGYKAKDSDLEPVHEVACEAATSTSVTYCER